MKVLVTPEFNKSIERLDKRYQKEAYRFFVKLSESEPLFLLGIPRVQKIASRGENIFVYRKGALKVYFTLNQNNGEKEAILLDAQIKKSQKSKECAL